MSEKMISKIPVSGSIIVMRDGKQKAAPKGKPFPFTAEEIADIERVHPNGLRDPVNEGGDEGEGGDDSEVTSVAKPADADAEPAKPAKGKGKAADDLGGL